MSFVILGLSLSSSWGNGHATTYRSLIKALTQQGHKILFLERDKPWYAANRDLPHPDFCDMQLYDSIEDLNSKFRISVHDADLVIVGSYVPEGVDVGAWALEHARGIVGFYDIDTPVTLAKLDSGNYEYITPGLIHRYHIYFSFTGGPMLKRLEKTYGSPKALPLYCSVDPKSYYPTCDKGVYDCGYMGTYSPDRQEFLNRFLIEPARSLDNKHFIVAGSQYPDYIKWPPNLEKVEHLQPERHCFFYNSQRFTLNITRRDMIAAGYSPSVRLFEAAACGVPVISDYWDGLETFFTLGEEILSARRPQDTTEYISHIDDTQRQIIGSRARQRILDEHTSEKRAQQLIMYVKNL
ncbi:MAG: glycosyltransferase [Chitinivibrionales bacterium]|nr:glycosyltransferase [Chitinivibrionales bacterium]